MLSQTTYGVIHTYVKLLTSLHSTPYELTCDGTSSVKVSVHWKIKIGFVIAMCQSHMYFAFLIFRLAQLLQESGPKSFETVTWVIFWTDVYLWAIVNQWNAINKKDEVVAINRGWIKLSKILVWGNVRFIFAYYFYL